MQREAQKGMEQDPASEPSTDSVPLRSDPRLDPSCQPGGERRLSPSTPLLPLALPALVVVFKAAPGRLLPGRVTAIHTSVFLAGAGWSAGQPRPRDQPCGQQPDKRRHKKGSLEVCFKYFYFLIYIKVYIWLIYLFFFLYSEIHNQLLLKNKIVICF